jgi:hypothetical protein
MLYPCGVHGVPFVELVDPSEFFLCAASRRTHVWKVQNYKAWLYMIPTARWQLGENECQKVMGV